MQMVQFLLVGSKDGRLATGQRAAAVVKFNSTARTVSRIWVAAMKQQQQQGVIDPHLQKFNVRSKRVHIDYEEIAKLKIGQRSTQLAIAEHVGCSQPTVSRRIKEKLIIPNTNSIKPELTAANKLVRLKFSLAALEYDAVMKAIKFKSMPNIVHIDEKWFYMTKGVKRYYMIPGEVEAHRTCKSKKFITKVMFMCAVCRPMYREDGSLVFDGKIGMFPFTEEIPAKRNSKHRVAGTLETKPINSVNKEVIRECIIEKILPAIKEKWPPTASKQISIQQDNAKPHISDNDEGFRHAASSDGFEFSLIQQPPNSPDTNVNDLGWFRSLEALQQKTSSKTVPELVDAVMNSFIALDDVKLNNVFLSLQATMKVIMEVRGGNNYKQPHIGKSKMIRAGTLPEHLEVSLDLVDECITYLYDQGETEAASMFRNALGNRMEEVQ